MAEKYLLFSLDDEKSKKLGEAISSKTAREIVNFLTEKEASETDIAKALDMPVNTVEYNLKKLLDAGVIEKSKKFFWSKKGKRIDIYKVANKLIVIAPKKSSAYSKIRSIIPVIVILGLITAILALSGLQFPKSLNQESSVQDSLERTMADNESLQKIPAVAGAGEMKNIESDAGILVEAQKEKYISGSESAWLWFLIGGLVVLLSFVLWNWKKL